MNFSFFCQINFNSHAFLIISIIKKHKIKAECELCILNYIAQDVDWYPDYQAGGISIGDTYWCTCVVKASDWMNISCFLQIAPLSAVSLGLELEYDPFCIDFSTPSVTKTKLSELSTFTSKK